MSRLIGKTLVSLIRGAFVALLFTVLTACAGGLVFHKFSFDAASESPNVQVLDYRYGNSQQPSARASDYDKSSGTVRQGVSINGDMLRGDSLNVRWRVKNTGVVYEDVVDLKAVLPSDIKYNKIHFTIKSTQLFVYLVTRDFRSPDIEPIGPREYNYLKVILLSSNFGREVTNP